MFVVFIEGFGLAISLCAAVGAQSLFIVERGMTRNYVFLICALCFMCDIVLMSMGVFGVGAYFAKNLYLSLCHYRWLKAGLIVHKCLKVFAPCRRFSLFEPLHRFDNPRLKKRRCLQHGAMMTQELEKVESFFSFFS